MVKMGQKGQKDPKWENRQKKAKNLQFSARLPQNIAGNYFYISNCHARMNLFRDFFNLVYVVDLNLGRGFITWEGLLKHVK